ncbi:Hsp20/alpha crystallin family protein [Pontibacter arcticus]|uniref:Hsp20/alpha crystallin family protein n=1 Tax=Pontibacter arcticus TaxID=2080288 RepID=A0A364RJ68_9BACT|nr:Hsp20/alpha crystallin family protein [Pontibacter arcticus]RAU84324.1 Hsp20/alpha crystallin family protein [Pontibacter arcticus]
MKLIKDKELLRNIAHQIDLLNTVGGGVSETQIDVTKYKKGTVVEVQAAGVSADAFKVVLHENKLIVSSLLFSEENENMAAPLFSKVFSLPPQVDRNRIEAIYSENRLQIKLPYQETDSESREIEIQKL